MNRRNTIFAMLIIVCLCGLFVLQVSAERGKPNIIFILADDLGMQDVGFMGSQYFETPNLDTLAEESLVFNQAYMYPTCSPSRAALLTGKRYSVAIYSSIRQRRGAAGSCQVDRL